MRAIIFCIRINVLQVVYTPEEEIRDEFYAILCEEPHSVLVSSNLHV